MNEPTQPLPVVALVKDLMFGAKIAATARASGRELVTVRDPGKLAGIGGALLLADLSIPGAPEAAAAWKLATGGTVVGFASHTKTELIEAAKQLGLDQVLAQSAFNARLESLMQKR